MLSLLKRRLPVLFIGILFGLIVLLTTIIIFCSLNLTPDVPYRLYDLMGWSLLVYNFPGDRSFSMGYESGFYIILVGPIMFFIIPTENLSPYKNILEYFPYPCKNYKEKI